MRIRKENKVGSEKKSKFLGSETFLKLSCERSCKCRTSYKKAIEDTIAKLWLEQ